MELGEAAQAGTVQQAATFGDVILPSITGLLMKLSKPSVLC